ncbi:hypothetical protein EON67_09850 [archaeon]|nr:MAG: hypothetical protein EON67_09850 [archaeon]
MQNPDVERYDPTGLRAAMTTNYAALRKELAMHRPNHLPTSSWVRGVLVPHTRLRPHTRTHTLQPHQTLLT